MIMPKSTTTATTAEADKRALLICWNAHRIVKLFPDNVDEAKLTLRLIGELLASDHGGDHWKYGDAYLKHFGNSGHPAHPDYVKRKRRVA
jgi:hypothetical protein